MKNEDISKPGEVALGVIVILFVLLLLWVEETRLFTLAMISLPILGAGVAAFFQSLNSMNVVASPALQKVSPTTAEGVGLIAFWGENSAFAFRTQAIPDTARTIQPYIQLHVVQAALYVIQFEIWDAHNTLVFSHKVEPFLLQATNLILPPARLPLADLAREGGWMLHVSVNGELLTTHEFGWRSDDINSVESGIDSDGEIDESILPMLADNYAKPLSLDTLLAGNDKQTQQEL